MMFLDGLHKVWIFKVSLWVQEIYWDIKRSYKYCLVMFCHTSFATSDLCVHACLDFRKSPAITSKLHQTKSIMGTNPPCSVHSFLPVESTWAKSGQLVRLLFFMCTGLCREEFWSNSSHFVQGRMAATWAADSCPRLNCRFFLFTRRTSNWHNGWVLRPIWTLLDEWEKLLNFHCEGWTTFHLLPWQCSAMSETAHNGGIQTGNGSVCLGWQWLNTTQREQQQYWRRLLMTAYSAPGNPAYNDFTSRHCSIGVHGLVTVMQ